ncbi:MAG: hypothetical protein ACYDB1_01240 [Acidiferrobacteraceae bacterium]
MSTIPLLPRYFIGTWQTHLDLAAGKILDANGRRLDVGEYHGWTPDESPTDSSVFFVVMKSSHGKPHPHWRAMPHLLDTTPVKVHLAPPAGQTENRTSLLAAWAQMTVPITDTDTTFSLACKLHKQMPVFEP